MTLDEQIEARLHDLLPNNDRSTAWGLIEWEEAERVLRSGQVLLVVRKEGHLPFTHAL
jgi:hypothetical protein